MCSGTCDDLSCVVLVVVFFAGGDAETSGGTSYGKTETSLFPGLTRSFWRCTEFSQPLDFPHNTISDSERRDIDFLQHRQVQLEKYRPSNFMPHEILRMISEASIFEKHSDVLRRPSSYLCQDGVFVERGYRADVIIGGETVADEAAFEEGC